MTAFRIALVVSLVAIGCGKKDKNNDPHNHGSNNHSNNTTADMTSPNNPVPDMNTLDDGTPPTPDMGEDMPPDPVDMAMTDDMPGDMGDMADMADMGGPCSRNGFVLAQQAVDFDVASNIFVYSGFNPLPTPGTPYDKFSFEIYPDSGGFVGAQNYTFPGQNYIDCGTCLLVFADCMTSVGCAKTFLVDSGSVSVTQAGVNDGDAFAASFSTLVFSEVTLDENFVSTPVVGGETYCITTLDASGTTVVF